MTIDSSDPAVVLIGPSYGGKTTLLMTAPMALQRGCHGYETFAPKLEKLPSADFDRSHEVKPAVIRLRPEPDPFAEWEETSKLAQDIENEQSAGPEPRDFHYKLTLDSQRKYYFKVTDTDGGVVLPRAVNDSHFEIPQSAFEASIAAITECDAIVLVIPLVGETLRRDEGWPERLENLLKQLPDCCTKLKRLVVVFSRYESLFIHFGAQAAAVAARQDAASAVILKTWRAAPWRDSLEKLVDSMPNLSVVYTVASAYGFVPGFGNPNLDPHRSDARRALQGPRRFKAQAGPSQDRGPSLLPFLAGDPFVYAATGWVSPYMMGKTDSVGDDPVDHASRAWHEARFEDDATEEGPAAKTAVDPRPPVPTETARPRPWSRALNGVLDYFDADRR